MTKTEELKYHSTQIFDLIDFWILTLIFQTPALISAM